MNSKNEDLHEYYKRRLEAGGSAATSVGWRDKQAQLNRFDQLAKVISCREDRFTINDLGCGLGDFCEYLASQGFRDFGYYGYDVFDFMIEGARKLYGSNKDHEFKTITDAEQMHTADYSIASGILNLKFKASEEEWLGYVLEQINKLNDKSVKGFAFNALTKYSDPEFMKDELYYADPCFLFDYCKRNISRNVALLHDYQEYDFTMIVRKA